MQSDNARGALLMMAGMAAFTASDSIMKLLAADLPMFQTLAWRGVIVSLVLAVMAWRKGDGCGGSPSTMAAGWRVVVAVAVVSRTAASMAMAPRLG